MLKSFHTCCPEHEQTQLFQKCFDGPVPGETSPSPAVALRDVLCVCVFLCLPLYLCFFPVDRAICTPCITTTVRLILCFVSSSSGNVLGQLSERFMSAHGAKAIQPKRQAHKTAQDFKMTFHMMYEHHKFDYAAK